MVTLQAAKHILLCASNLPFSCPSLSIFILNGKEREFTKALRNWQFLVECGVFLISIYFLQVEWPWEHNYHQSWQMWKRQILPVSDWNVILTFLKLAWWVTKDRDTAGSGDVVAIIPFPCFELLSKKILCQVTLAPPAISTLTRLATDRFFNFHNCTLHSKGLKERKSGIISEDDIIS